MWYPRNSENGQGLVEYALILVLIAVVVIAILTLLGDQVDMVFARITLALQEPGNYSGDPVTASISVTAGPWPGGIIRADAPVNLTGATGSPSVCVRFTNSQGGSKIVCDPNPYTTFSGSGPGTIEGCVIGVQGYGLRSIACDADTY
jgi:pilus assembly protein Flp/PilA